MEHLEIEIKFCAENMSLIKERIVKSGASCKGKVFETNILFDDSNKSLTRKKSLLRLRKDKKNRLTFKSLPTEVDNNFKILKELEVDVSDFATMHLILESLGFKYLMKYEKWRETFETDQGTQICIDIMPYGNFLEIEGKKEDIKDFAHKIGLEWDSGIILNYNQIFNIIKESLGLKFSDITFENFKNLKIDLKRYLNLFCHKRV